MFEKVKEYLLNDVKILEKVVNEINSSNGDLEHLDYKYFNEFTINEYFDNPYDFAMRVYFGDVKFHHQYWNYDNVGNIETLADKKEVIDNMKYYIDDVVNSLIECNYWSLDIPSELKEILEG